MAKFQITTIDLIVNQVSGGDYWFFVYDADKLKIKKDTAYVDVGSIQKTQTKYTIFAADTEQECINKIIELGLT